MKKTKIVATISDKRCDVDFLQNLYRAGMNVDVYKRQVQAGGRSRFEDFHF